MHDPSNNSCPRNADPRNECCDCDHPQSGKLKRIKSPRYKTYSLSALHHVVNREDKFEVRVRMVNGEVAAEWRPITVNETQRKFGGYSPDGEWRPCTATFVE
jgi:hypothetical protein